MKKKTIHIRAC